MCSAIHITSRSWLRSSSTREPSDPPFRVVIIIKAIDDQHSIAGVCETRRHVRSVRATGAPSRSRGVGLSTREPSAKGRPRERDRPSAWKPTVRRSPARETPRAGSPAPGRLPTRDRETARPRDHETWPLVPLVPWSHGPAEISRRRAPAVDASRKPTESRETLTVSRPPGTRRRRGGETIMILPQVHLRKPCYDFYFL